MNQINKKIKFTTWIKWSERNNLDNIDLPGVYILAKFKTPPKESSYLDENIIYIGETCNQKLKTRLNQFNRSAFQEKNGHSGGWSYAEKFDDDDGSNLYVAIFPLDESKDINSMYIRYFERKIILKYALQHGWDKLLNKK